MPTDPIELAASAARRLNDNRARVLAGEDIDPAEYKLIIDEMRTIRLAAAQSEFRRPRASKVPSVKVNLEDLLK